MGGAWPTVHPIGNRMPTTGSNKAARRPERSGKTTGSGPTEAEVTRSNSNYRAKMKKNVKNR